MMFEASRKTNYLVKNLAKVMAGFGLLSEDLEYHLLRASMVIIFAFFGYTKWHQYAAQTMIPFISNSPFYLLAVSGFRPARRRPFFRCHGVDDLRASVCGILG